MNSDTAPPPNPDPNRPGQRIDNWPEWMTQEGIAGVLADAVRVAGCQGPAQQLSIWPTLVVGAMARALIELGAFDPKTGRVFRPAASCPPAAKPKAETAGILDVKPATPGERALLRKLVGMAAPGSPRPAKTPQGPTSRPPCRPGDNPNGCCCTCRYWSLQGSTVDEERLAKGEQAENFYGLCRCGMPVTGKRPWPLTWEYDTCSSHNPMTRRNRPHAEEAE